MENNQSVGKEVWSLAEKAGAERRQKIDRVINRIFGLPEAVGKLAEIGGEKAKAKAEELKEKAIDLKERTDLKVAETKEKWTNRFESARDNLFSRIEAFKNKVTDKAVELKNRAVKAGLESGLKIEDKIVKILETPAVLRESKAGEYDKKAESAEESKEKALVKQFSLENGLSEVQAAALEKFMARQEKQKTEVKENTEKVRVKFDIQIEAARTKSQELRSEASKKRESLEKGRVFKKLLENFKNK